MVKEFSFPGNTLFRFSLSLISFIYNRMISTCHDFTLKDRKRLIIGIYHNRENIVSEIRVNI